MLDELSRLGVRPKRALVFLFLAGLAVFASMPLFTQLGANPGHDMTFHLYRILGIADGLRDGQFPVRIQYSQLNGMGYPVSIMYGDALLYFPAALVVLGLSVLNAYKVFLLCINIAVVGSTYVFAARFSNNRLISLAVTSVWTLGTYRLVDLYLRGAVGEYLGLAFFPVLAYGLWCAFTSRGNRTTRLPAAIWIAVGMVGIVLSHVISVVLAVFALGGIAISLLIVGDRKKAGAEALAIGAILTIALGAFFIGPFFEWYKQGGMLVQQSSTGTIEYARDNAGTLAQLLELFPTMSGYSQSLDYGAKGEMPLAIGVGALGLVLIFLASSCVLERKGEPGTLDRHRIPPSFSHFNLVCVILFAFFLVTVILCSVPKVWSERLPFMSLLAVIQYPWRFLGPVLFLSCILGLIGLMSLDRPGFQKIMRGSAALICVLAVIEGGATMTSAIENTPVQEPIYAVDSNSQHIVYGVMGGEYLNDKCDLQAINEMAMTIRNEDVVSEDGFSMVHVADNGRRFDVSLDGSESDIVLPLIWYQNYQVVESNASVELSQATNGCIEIKVEPGYSGTISLKFIPDQHWIIYDAISLITLLGVIVVSARSCVTRRSGYGILG